MVNNLVNVAFMKLEQHYLNGENSQLSIIEVAELLDTINFYSNLSTPKTSIFFGFSQN
jgi:hypothetical protein